MSYPTRVPSWRRYLRFWGSSVQSDIDAELRFHFDARISELVAQGESLATARARAIEEFGDVTQVSQTLRDIDGRMARRRSRLEWIGGVRDDVVYGIRSLRRTPGVTTTIILTLALGLGVNAAMFSFLDQIFGRYPAGVARPETIHRLWTARHFSERAEITYWPGFDYPGYRTIRDAIGERARVSMYRTPMETKLGSGEAPPKAMVAYAAAGFFEILGVKPAVGRLFSPAENELGANAPVAL